MATNKIALPGGNNNYELTLVTTKRSEDKGANTSTIYVVLKLVRKGGSGFWSYNTQKVVLNVGSKTFNIDNKGYDFRDGKTEHVLATATETLKHAANGSGSVNVSGSFTATSNDIANGAIGSGSVNLTHTFTTFTRSATLSSVPSTRTLGVSYPITLSNVSSGLTYRFEVLAGSTILYSRNISGSTNVLETSAEVHNILNTLNGANNLVYKLTTLSGTTVVGTSTKTGYVYVPPVSSTSSNKNIVLGVTSSITATLTGLSATGGITISSGLYLGSTNYGASTGTTATFAVNSSSFIQACMQTDAKPEIRFVVATSNGTVIGSSTVQFSFSINPMTVSATLETSINTVKFNLSSSGNVVSSLTYEYSVNNGVYTATTSGTRLTQVHSASKQTLRFRVKQNPHATWHYSPVYEYTHLSVAKEFSVEFPEYLVGNTALIRYTNPSGVSVEFTPVAGSTKPVVVGSGGVARIPLTEDYVSSSDAVAVVVSARSYDSYGSYNHGNVLTFTVRPEEKIKVFSGGKWIKAEAFAYNRPLLGTYNSQTITLSVEDTNLSTGQLFYGSRSLRPATPFPTNTTVYMECEFEHVIVSGTPRETDFLELRIGGSNMIIHNIPYGQKSKFSGIISTDSTGGIPLVIYGFNKHTPAIRFSEIKVHTATGTFLPVTFSKYQGSGWIDQ